MKFLLDYGHGGNDPGAIGIDGVKEKDIVLEIGKRVKYHLERHQIIIIESIIIDRSICSIYWIEAIILPTSRVLLLTKLILSFNNSN